MIRKCTILALSLVLAAPVAAEGPIGTIERGRYVCELPSDIPGEVAQEQPEENFEIAGASRYRSPQGGGTYLRRGDRVVMSSGPRNGVEYAVISPSMVRKVENGQPGRLRCYRRGR